MSDFTDHEITEAMIVYGGGFVSALGRLFRQADDINQRRLRKAFPEYWEEYRSIAELARRRASGKNESVGKSVDESAG